MLHPVLKQFNDLLEEMIELQKKEQQLILERRTDILPITSESIEWLGLRMQGMEVAVRRELEQPGRDQTEKKISEKLAQIRRLAQQNRTLIEHSLFFLQKLFQHVMERDTPLHLYSMAGATCKTDISGGLLETRV